MQHSMLAVTAMAVCNCVMVSVAVQPVTATCFRELYHTGIMALIGIQHGTKEQQVHACSMQPAGQV